MARLDGTRVPTQKQKVSLEFTIDDTGSAMEKDTLLDITFFVPDSSKVHGVPGDEDTAVLPAASLTKDLLAKADVGAAAGDTAIATFTDVACLVPRLKMDIELSASMLYLQGSSQDFRIKYSSLIRIFLLPKPNMPQTVVVLTLDPPIRQGKTFYAHVLLQVGKQTRSSGVSNNLRRQQHTPPPVGI